MNPLCESISEKYRNYCRPKLGSLLGMVRLDIAYEKAEGDHLYFTDPAGTQVKVADFLGGYGAGLFGHNNPTLVKTAIESLANGLPFNAQGSIRSETALLAEKLNEMMYRHTGRKYIVTCANSGTEAVEAAIKHAELSRRNKINNIRNMLNKRYVALSQSVSRDALNDIRSQNDEALSVKPVFAALRRGFHGKTTGALQLTYNTAFREPFEQAGIRSAFVDANDPADLESLIEANTIKFFWPAADKDGGMSVTPRTVSAVSAIFVEPIQGEGGIIKIPRETLQRIRTIADENGIPLVFDEIQCGMGRTGTFTCSQQSGVTADYYLLSKSLGGGIAKTAALLVSEDQYEEDFGFIHSSTFAEDSHSSRIALRALELLEADDIPAQCARKGDILLEGLRRIQAEYPSVIREVRGAGLMLGIEFCDFKYSGSMFLRMLSEQKMLGYVVAGYLLHEHHVRVAPALSSNSTIRLEPSAYIPEKEIELLLSAISRLCEIIYKQNVYALLKFAVNAETPGRESPVKDFRQPDREECTADTGIPKVAFLGHLIEAQHMCRAEPAFTEFSREQLVRLIDTFHTVIGPTLSEDKVITSLTGDKVRFQLFGLFMTSSIIERYMRAHDTGIVTEQIRAAVDMAVSEGCRAIGFGGYTSIVTNNCQMIATEKAALTSGNSLTVAMGVEAMLTAAETGGFDLSKAVFAVVGAAGNIASTYSEIMAEHVSRIILIGRPGKEKQVKKVAARIIADAYERIARGNEKITGAGEVLRNAERVKRLLKEGIKTIEVEEQFYEDLLSEMGDSCPVICSSDISMLSRADLILSASNSAEPVIYTRMLKNGPVIICDIAVPADVHPSVSTERGDVTVLQGGIVKLPLNPDLSMPGIPLNKGELFACMSETALLGLQGIREHYSYGQIRKNQVQEIMQIARRHGFKLGRLKVEKSY